MYVAHEEGVVVLQSSEVDYETVNEANDEDKEASPAANMCESMLPISSDDTTTTVATCQHCDLIAENEGAISDEMCLPVKSLVKRGKKSTNEDQTNRYPPIIGTVSERCVQSVGHIIKVFCYKCVSL